MSKGNSGGGASVGGGGAATAPSGPIDPKKVRSMESLSTRQANLGNAASRDGNSEAARQHRGASVAYNEAAKLYDSGDNTRAAKVEKIAKEYADAAKKLKR